MDEELIEKIEYLIAHADDDIKWMIDHGEL